MFNLPARAKVLLARMVHTAQVGSSVIMVLAVDPDIRVKMDVVLLRHQVAPVPMVAVHQILIVAPHIPAAALADVVKQAHTSTAVKLAQV